MKTAQLAEYSTFLQELKERIHKAQYAALKAVNKELIALYWNIGKSIVDRQDDLGWGKSVVETLARDLQNEFLGIQGFSAPISGGCVTFSLHIMRMKNLRHWCEKSAGPKMSSSLSVVKSCCRENFTSR